MRRLSLFAWFIALAGCLSASAVETDQEITALYKQGKYAECLAAIEARRAAGPLNNLCLSTSAHCKLGMNNTRDARTEYTQLLTQLPLTPDLWVGRAKCELAMNSIRDAEADYAIAVQINAKAVEFYREGYNAMLAAAKQADEKESLPVIWPKFVAAGPKVSDTELLMMAARIIRARNATRHIGDEDFTRTDAQLALQVRDKPDDLQALLDEAEFLLDPLVVYQVSFEGKNYAAKVLVHDAEAARAEALVARALKIDPSSGRAMAQMAQVCVDAGRHAEAFDWADKAIAAGTMTVDVCRMHLIASTNAAQPLDAEAARLRQPTSRTIDRIENGQRVQRTIQWPPTPTALAEADRLTAQADALRRKAAAPLQKLIEKTQASNAPADELTGALANAYFSEWRGRYDDAIGWAKHAVELDPFQSEALRMIVQLCANMHEENTEHAAQARLFMAQNPSAGVTLASVWPLMKQGQFAQARQALARADLEDPGAIELAYARFAMAQEEGKLDDAVNAERLCGAMNRARVFVDGRSITPKLPTAPEGVDVVVPVYTSTIAGGMLNDAGRSDAALERFNRAIALGARVPAKELSTPVPDAAVPNDKLNAPAGTYLGAVLGSAHRQAAELLLNSNHFAEAAPHLLAAANAGDATPQLPWMAYKCFKRVGVEGFGGPIPDAWRERFRILDQQHADVSTPDRPDQNIDLQIDQITRQINQGVGPDDERALIAKRDALIAKRNKLRQGR